MSKLLITGATGHLGGAVINTLLKRISPGKISMITRDENKRLEFQAKGINAFLGNYEDTTSLSQAMENVDQILLTSAGDKGNRMQEHRNVIDTAKERGVKNIAYTSRSLRDRSTLVNKLMSDHFETEDYIKASGLNYTIFRNILYMDALPLFVGGQAALDTGIFLPAGEGKAALALRSEMGEAIANVLMKEEGTNKTYNFTGDQAYSFSDVAAALTTLSGKQVNYSDITPEAFADRMKQRNIPGPMIQKIIDFITDIKNNQENTISNDLEFHLGRKPLGLKEGLKIAFGL